MGHAEPRIRLESVAQIDHHFYGDAFDSARGVVRARTLRPRTDLRAVGAHPIHEAQATDTAPAHQEIGMKRLFRVRSLKARHNHAQVAHGVGGICGSDLQEEAALGRIHLNNRTVGFVFHHRSRACKGQLSLAFVQNRVASGRIVSFFNCTQRRLGIAPRFEFSDPTALIQRQRWTFSPGLAPPLTDPCAGEPEGVDERQLRVPVART